MRGVLGADDHAGVVGGTGDVADDTDDVVVEVGGVQAENDVLGGQRRRGPPERFGERVDAPRPTRLHDLDQERGRRCCGAEGS